MIGEKENNMSIQPTQTAVSPRNREGFDNKKQVIEYLKSL